MKLRVPEGLGAVYAQAKTVTKRNLFLVEQKCETKNPGANEVSDAAFTGCYTIVFVLLRSREPWMANG